MRRETASLPPRYRLATGSLPPRYNLATASLPHRYRLATASLPPRYRLATASRLATANAVGFCVQTPSMRRIHARPSKFSRRHTLRLANAVGFRVQTHPARTKLSVYAWCTPEIE